MHYKSVTALERRLGTSRVSAIRLRVSATPSVDHNDMSRSRGWCFTINNWTQEEHDGILESDVYRYVIFGREVGEQGTRHLQGYVYYRQPQSLNQLKTLFPRAHLEVQKGTNDQAIEYCKKDGDYVESGEPPMNQKRKGELEKQRWADALAFAKQGMFDDIPDDIRFRYYRTCKDIAKDHMVKPPQLDDVCGEWIYGRAGVGKSRRAHAEHPDAYLKPTNKWWDGYQGEEVVIIDDLDPDHACLRRHIKMWTDRYPFIAEAKGSSIQIRPKRVIITSQYHPQDIFLDEPTREAILRRCTLIHME